jgi:hypothetical protein
MAVVVRSVPMFFNQFKQQINHTVRYMYRSYDHKRRHMHLRTYVQLHLHSMALNEAEDNTNLYTSNNLFRGETTVRLSSLFLENVLSLVRFSKSALRDLFAKEISFTCSQTIISAFLQVCVGNFSTRTLTNCTVHYN